MLGWFWAFGTAPVLGAGWKTLPGHVPSVIHRLAARGALPATNELRLAIGLPLRDAAGLDQFLAGVSDPASPHFRQYLTPEEFTARFGPTEADYAAVTTFALANGLTITATHRNRLVLDVRGRAAQVERAFHVRLQKFQHPREAREFFAPDGEPSVADFLPVADVAGLTDYERPHSKLHPAAAAVTVAKAAPKSGSGAGGNYAGSDFRNAYAAGTSLTGAGQMVGLLQFDGFYTNDISAYEDLMPGPPRVPIETVLLDGFNGVPTAGANNGNAEVSLDIEIAIAMAPGLAKIVVFEAPSLGGQPNDILNAMAARSEIKNLSCSWGWSGQQNATTENIFKQMAAQGQSFFNASGDSAAFTAGQVDDPTQANNPSASPNITQVGGTVLQMNGPGDSYASEAVWNSGGGTGSGGGVSSANSIPAWQQGLDMTANHGSTTGRNLPDVAMVAESVYVAYGNGGNGAFVGTSCAAPLWAGFMALVNQQAAAAGNPPAGFVNPAIYALGRSADYHLYFHDTTAGDNTRPGSPTNFPATTGYDLCTGWGTPNGTNLISALAALNLSTHLADVVRPTVSIISPVNNLKWSNDVFSVSGTAGDNVAVSNVFYSANGADWGIATTVGHGASWSANVALTPGTNTIQAYVQDTSGNYSMTNRVSLICILSAPLAVSTNGRGSISPSYNGARLQLGANYALTATAAAGFKFTGWLDAEGQVVTNSPALKFLMTSNLAFTANFADIAKPTNAILAPLANQRWSNAVFTVAGKASDNVGVANVFYSLNGADWTPTTNTTGWSNWTAGVTLTPGTNLIQTYAMDGAGNLSTTNRVSLVYIVSAPLIVRTNGRGSISPTYNGARLQVGANYTLTAIAATGFKFTGWTDGDGLLLTNRAALTFMMASNLAFTANFVDVTKPTLSIVKPVNNQKGSNYLCTLSGKAIDNVTVTNVFYSLNGGAWSRSLTADNWTNWTAQVSLVPGTNTLAVCAVDMAGNRSATNQVSFVYVFALGGTWNVVQLQTPSQMTLTTSAGLAGGRSFGATNGTLSFNADGTLNGQFEDPFTGTYVPGSNGLVATTIVTSAATNYFNLFINASQDTMTLVDAQRDESNNQQELLMFQRAPTTNTLGSLAGAWNVVQWQTPGQVAWDEVNGLQGGDQFSATKGSLVLNVNGTLSGNLGGAFTGSYRLGSNGVVNLATVAGGQTNTHTLFVNASRNAMALVEGPLDGSDPSQQITLFQRMPLFVLPTDPAGLWSLVQLRTPAQLSGDAINGLQGGGNFGAASGSVRFNANGTITGNLNGAFAGIYQTGNAGVIKLTLMTGSATNSIIVYLNASKDAMMGVASRFDHQQNDQQLLLLQRVPAN